MSVQKWGNEMRFGGFLAVTVLLLITLVGAFPQTFQEDRRDQLRDARTNTEDHMVFTKELAQHGSELASLSKQQTATSNVPERMARIEERLDNMGRMIFAILAGILSLIGKEAWYAMRHLRTDRLSGDV